MRVSWEVRKDFYFGFGLIYNVKAGSMVVRINNLYAAGYRQQAFTEHYG
jgi:hypothetical protein